MTYNLDCQLCKEENVKATYFGESARTMYDRGSEHMSALMSRSPDSVLVQHMVETHEGMEPTLTMKLVKSHQSPLYRQVHEGLLIDQFKGEIPMNRKGEWGSNVPETLAVIGRDGEVITGTKRGREGHPEGDNPPKRSIYSDKESDNQVALSEMRQSFNRGIR